jgi:prevent-host-death family protein
MKAAHIRPITDLKNHTKELVQEVADGGQPVIITQNGKPKVVVMDVAQHDRLQDTLAMLKLLAQSQDALARTGRVYSSAEVRRRAKAALQKASRRK